MVVTVQFFGLQRLFTRAHQLEIPLPGESRVRDLVGYIKGCYPDIPLEEDDFLITVNNQVVNPNEILSPHDSIAFLPHIGGG
jgi:molybdopterin converting factor small subunit